MDGYIVKFDGASHNLIWSTFIDAFVSSFKPDEGGNMVASMSTKAGSLGSTALPVLPRPNTYFQPLHADQIAAGLDAMVMWFSPSDELLSSTYFGGLGDDRAICVLPSAAGRLYLVGSSRALAAFPFSCPPTPNPYCYLTYATQSPATGEAFYAQLMYDVTIGIDMAEVDHTGPGLAYPNPSDGGVFLEVPVRYQDSGAPSVQVHDATGRLVAERILTDRVAPGLFRVEAGRPGDGLRLLRVLAADGTVIGTYRVLLP